MKRTSPLCRSQTGATLLELLIYMAILGLVGASLVGVVQNSMGAYQDERVRMRAKEDIRAAMNLMTREIRMAGCDPDPEKSPSFKIVTKQPQHIRFTMDIYPIIGRSANITGVSLAGGGNATGDGKHTGPGEDVTYLIEDGDLKRTAIHDDFQLHTETLLENVTMLQFDYFEVDETTGNMVATLGDEIDYVQITLAGLSGLVNQVTGLPETVQASTFVNCRNLMDK